MHYFSIAFRFDLLIRAISFLGIPGYFGVILEYLCFTTSSDNCEQLQHNVVVYNESSKAKFKKIERRNEDGLFWKDEWQQYLKTNIPPCVFTTGDVQ